MEWEKFVFDNPWEITKVKGKRTKTPTAILVMVKDAPPPLLLSGSCIAAAVTMQGGGNGDHSNGGEDGFFLDIDDSSIKCDDNKIPCCHMGGSPEVPPGDTGNDGNAIEASLYEIFALQVKVKSLMGQNNMTDPTKTSNIPEYMCDNLPDFMFVHEGSNGTNSNLLVDTPIVLVGDDRLVCLPCENADANSGADMTGNHGNTSNIACMELSEEELARIWEEEKNKKCEEEKAKWQLWKTILGNGIIDQTELMNKLTMDLLCQHC